MEIIKRAEILLKLRQAVLLEHWSTKDIMTLDPDSDSDNFADHNQIVNRLDTNKDNQLDTVENLLLIWYSTIYLPTSSYGSEEIKIISNTLFNNVMFDKYLSYSSNLSKVNNEVSNNNVIKDTNNNYINTLIELLANHDSSQLNYGSYASSTIINEKIEKCEILFNLALINRYGLVRSLKMITNNLITPKYNLLLMSLYAIDKDDSVVNNEIHVNSSDDYGIIVPSIVEATNKLHQLITDTSSFQLPSLPILDSTLYSNPVFKLALKDNMILSSRSNLIKLIKHIINRKFTYMNCYNTSTIYQSSLIYLQYEVKWRRQCTQIYYNHLCNFNHTIHQLFNNYLTCHNKILYACNTQKDIEVSTILSIDGLAYITRNISLLANNGTINTTTNTSSNNDELDRELNNKKTLCNEVIINMSPKSRNLYQNSKLLNYVISLKAEEMKYNSFKHIIHSYFPVEDRKLIAELFLVSDVRKLQKQILILLRNSYEISNFKNIIDISIYIIASIRDLNTLSSSVLLLTTSLPSELSSDSESFLKDIKSILSCSQWYINIYTCILLCDWNKLEILILDYKTYEIILRRYPVLEAEEINTVQSSGKPVRRKTGLWNFVKNKVLDNKKDIFNKTIPKPARSLCDFATNIMNYKKNIAMYDNEFFQHEENFFLTHSSYLVSSINMNTYNENNNNTSIEKHFFTWINFDDLKHAISLTSSNESSHTEELMKKRDIAINIIHLHNAILTNNWYDESINKNDEVANINNNDGIQNKSVSYILSQFPDVTSYRKLSSEIILIEKEFENYQLEFRLVKALLNGREYLHSYSHIITADRSYRRNSIINQANSNYKVEDMINIKELQDTIDSASRLHDRNERNSSLYESAQLILNLRKSLKSGDWMSLRFWLNNIRYLYSFNIFNIF